jgi:hypothetical protein
MKVWIVNVVGLGMRFEIEAPTRKLALAIFYADHPWSWEEKIIVTRKQ